MTQETRQDSGPPQLLFKIMNPIIKGILASPLHFLLDDSLMLITFRGRKTGKSYTIPVGYHRQPGGTLLVFSSHTWWKNLRGGKPVTLRLRGEKVAAMAEPVTDREAVMEQVEKFIAEHGTANTRRIGVHLDNPDPSPEELARAAQNTVFMRVTPQDTA